MKPTTPDTAPTTAGQPSDRTPKRSGVNILVINPGSTSTKIAVYEDEKPVMLRNIHHSPEELKQFEKITDQRTFRRDLVIRELEYLNIPMNFDIIIGRGGLARPVAGGVYRVNEKMCMDSYNAIRKHACNLGCMIALELANGIPGCLPLIADPGMVDELDDVARISGSPLMPRIAIWHALNQRAIARRFAREYGKRYEDLNLIICHLGGGISVAVHRHGLAVDANNALDGEGPLSPERAGTLPAADLIHLCYSGKYTKEQLLKRIAGQAGLVAHLGTTNVKEIIGRIEQGDEKARLLIDAMIYQTAKTIAGDSAVLYGKVDAILLTGGIAYSDYITSRLRERIEFLAPVHIYPGEDEMQALALNALAVWRGQRELKEYR
ncbi:MAG: butyrate kinase [Bacteroidales bacterium]|nr:butyrate kinase [Bacteroidales bacterium]